MRTCKLCLEQLESRELLSAVAAPFAVPTYKVKTNGGIGAPLSSAGPNGYTPTQIRHAYGFDQIKFASGTIAGDGTGMTIAIVDAYDDPNMVSDLKAFDTQFSLPGNATDNNMSFFTKVNQNGNASPLPTASGSTGWSEETSLDVEWAHAIAPGAKILLVETNSSSFGNLFTGVDTASNWSGVVAVSMSWGGGEFSGESVFDSHFTHANITYLVSSGDTGAPDSYPSSSPNVVSVGGTNLKLDGSNNWSVETGWSGSGGGISAYEPQPSYQSGVVNAWSTTKRTNPDVSYDSDPNTGFPVYDSYDFGTSAPWAQFGGTSDAAPQWAALIAIADQGRNLNGLAPLSGATDTLPKLYALPAADFHDITGGTSTGHPNYTATTGYDLVTGMGTPFANLVVSGLGATVQAPPAVQIADDSTSQAFATTGAWVAYSGSGPMYDGNMHYAPAGTGANVASWTFTVTPGLFRVSSTWWAWAGRASNAPYTVLDGSTSQGTVLVNQQLDPSGLSDQGSTWQDLGTFTIFGNQLVVQLSDNADG
ncbi:MAG TPA: hypothetical protein VNX28_01845, partial [Gemmataceae bacterium]|nr:hypothetical protein [Gemmataceae bacterium]